MTIYTVHAPPADAPPERDLSRVAFVKEGFCWPALFLAPIWLIFRRLWIVLLLYILVGILIGLASSSYAAASVVGPLFALWFALEANQLRRWTLDRSGWHFIGVAVGRNRIEAEDRFFRDFLEGGRRSTQSPSTGSSQGRASFVANPGPAA